MKSPALILISSLFILKIGAQNPVFIPAKTSYSPQNHPENACNFAGTIAAGQFSGQSNDTDLDTIFLCLGDSIQINHLGDADLSGDPDPATVPGIVYGYYSCSPTVSGPSLSDVVNDPCILQGASSGLFVTQGVPNGGDTWFFNNGSLQNNFNLGQPLSLFYAPITIDDYVSNTYESGQIGIPPGPCVHANIEEAFEVVYLNQITATGIDNNFGNDCIGRFTVRNGYPQYDLPETYDIDISLTSDPVVKGLVMTPISNFFHLSSVWFTVCEPGLYTVNIEDGKSCGHSFEVDMSGCNAADNIGLNLGEVTGITGETVCIPLQVTNFDILASTFSITWNPALLHFTEISQINPAIANLIDSNFVSTTLASTGNLELLLHNASSANTLLHVPDGEPLFEICFEVLDSTANNTIPIRISNTINGIWIEDSLGQYLGICTKDGGVNKPVATADLDTWKISKIFPNPVKSGSAAYLDFELNQSTIGQMFIRNIHGVIVQEKEFELSTGENRIALPINSLQPGIYFASVMEANAILGTYKMVIL